MNRPGRVRAAWIEGVACVAIFAHREAVYCHVLIIEDEILVALDIQHLLAENGASSFAFASTELNAVEEARVRKPEFISSGVCLEEGLGSNAVATIHREFGYIPTLYITATPESCFGCPPEHVLPKPLQEAKIVALFGKLAPVSGG